jgi:hypothetical protein
MEDGTLGGYRRKHDRPPAFEGSDGRAYSAEIFVDPIPTDDGRYGAAVLFVQWSDGGDRPVAHLETPFLAHGDTPANAEALVAALTLHEVKAHLDQMIAERSPKLPEW